MKTSFSSKSLLPPSQPQDVYCCTSCIRSFDTKEKCQDHQVVCLKELQVPGKEIFRQGECYYYLVDGKEDLAKRLESVGRSFVPRKKLVDLEDYNLVVLVKRENGCKNVQGYFAKAKSEEWSLNTNHLHLRTL